MIEESKEEPIKIDKNFLEQSSEQTSEHEESDSDSDEFVVQKP